MATQLKQQKRLIRLITAFSDMYASIRAANLLLAGVPDEVYEHLFLAMVVAYGRPFTQNYGAGRIQCDYPHYPEPTDAEMVQRHNRLLDLRNKFLAHSSAEGTRVEIIPPGIAYPSGASPRSKFDFNVGRRLFPDIRFVGWLRVAPDTFGRRLHMDIEHLLEQAFSGRIDPTKAFDLSTGHENFKWT